MRPAEWPGIGYLPDDVQAIAGVRVAAALESAAGRAMLAAFGVSDVSSAKVLGLKLTAIDHFVIGANVRALPPRLIAAVYTRGRLQDLRSREAAGRSIEHHGIALLRGKLWANGPEGMTWQADDHMLIAAQLPEDFDHVPAQPQPGVDRFHAPLPDLLTDRLDPAAIAWLVLAADDKTATIGLAASMLPLPPTDRDALSKLQAFAMSLRADGPKVTLTLHVRGRDAAAGDAIAKAVADSLTRAGVDTLRRTGSDEPADWQQVTATTDAKKLAAWLGTLRGK